jgi:hypothetical protein
MKDLIEVIVVACMLTGVALLVGLWCGIALRVALMVAGR